MDKISEISYMFFRNLRNLPSWELGDVDLLVITGENQQGKTNLLEAFYTAITGESFRTNRLAEIITHGKDQAMSSVKLSSGTHLRFVVSSKDGERASGEFFLNDEKIAKKDNPYRYRAIHFLRIEADRLMVPSEFTKIVGKLMLRIFDDYRGLYTEYMAWVRKRNELLRSPSLDTKLIKILDRSKLVPLCKKLRNRREEYIRNLLSWINTKLSVEMDGLSVSIETTKKKYGVPLEVERDRGTTLWGIHRDKMSMVLYPEGRKIPTQGIQVYLLFLLKMGLLAQKKSENRYYFFLDDIGWELDKYNFSRILMHMFSIGQVFFASPWWHSDIEQYIHGDVNIAKVVMKTGKLL